ncbi:hypothetical protein [Paracoccus sediminicola]|uniref:hypothetical protein n=1 Tax=Paracoccus sediminicola TaxID=3017783 RepID=UPI0022F024EB|nr:hypothetical protein [Paracoccus sediminicola]WBU56730.1 hypothetical protein PAF18_14850 [Paracoccus sediminicola]
MMLAAVLLSGSIGFGAQGQGFEELTRVIDGLVLSGRSLPPAFLLDVERLPSASDRMLALIYLRRSGMLTGDPVALDELVFDGPAPTDAEPWEGIAQNAD